MGLPSRTCWTGSQLVQLIEKNSETLPADSSKNKESKKNRRPTLCPDEGELAETMQCVYKMGLPSRTCSQLVQLIEKNSETLPTDSLKNKESKKKKKCRSISSLNEEEPTETTQCDPCRRPNSSHQTLLKLRPRSSLINQQCNPPKLKKPSWKFVHTDIDMWLLKSPETKLKFHSHEASHLQLLKSHGTNQNFSLP